MASKNEHTNEMIISKRTSTAFRQNYEQIFGNKQADKRGRFVYDRETKSFVPAHEYYAKQQAKLDAVRSNLNLPALHLFKPYNSPITGKPIESPNQMREDLKRNHCVLADDLKTEEQETQRRREYMNKKMEAEIDDAVLKTANDLKYNLIPKPEPQQRLDLFADE